MICSRSRSVSSNQPDDDQVRVLLDQQQPIGIFRKDLDFGRRSLGWHQAAVADSMNGRFPIATSCISSTRVHLLRCSAARADWRC